MIPAFCDRCGTAFPSGIFIGNVTNLTLMGNRAGPCPKCGAMGHVPDGVFNVLGAAIEIISAPSRTFEELTKLSAILQESQALNESPAAVAEKVEREIPGLSVLMELMPQNQANWYAFISVLLTIIQLYFLFSPPASSHATSAPQITINQVIEQTIINGQVIQPVPKRGAKKIGRNEQCPCGSGIKYKKCCGNSK